MNKEKAFTLVELLAVIVILAIVLIIAVPGVLGIINKTKGNALERQVDMIKEAARLYMTSDSDVTWVGEDTKMTTVTLDTLKSKGYLDQKIMDPKTKKEITCAKTVITKMGSKYDYDVTLCDQVNASPRLSSNMISIVYKDNRWVKADYMNKDNNWYNYDNQQWANVATVTGSTREAYKKANIGSEVKMEDINTMFVWIPRFKYKLFNVDGTVSPVGNSNMAGDYLIDVQLEDTNTPKSTGTQNGQWLTHPAFTFGGQELEGFWIGKFETGSAIGSGTEIENNVVDSSRVLIKPNISSWTSIQLVNIYKSAREMSGTDNSFGLTYNEDPHLTKNMEWGAMAYLTYSSYGKGGNSDYDGLEKEVGPNTNADSKTGCGNVPSAVESSDICNSYDTVLGQVASTTGNITGVYDTSGGAHDYVAGVIKAMNGQDILIGNSGFEQTELNRLAKEEKYIDIYEYSKDGSVWSGHLGDATIEMGPFRLNGMRTSWYEDSARYPVGEGSPSFSWFARGNGFLDQSVEKGTITFGRGSGAIGTNRGFRITMI